MGSNRVVRAQYIEEKPTPDEERKARAVEEEKKARAAEEERKARAAEEERKAWSIELERRLRGIEEDRKARVAEEERRVRAAEEEKKSRAAQEKKEIVHRLLMDARQRAANGDVLGAIEVAKRAESFQASEASPEDSPATVLLQLVSAEVLRQTTHRDTPTTNNPSSPAKNAAAPCLSAQPDSGRVSFETLLSTPLFAAIGAVASILILLLLLVIVMFVKLRRLAARSGTVFRVEVVNGQLSLCPGETSPVLGPQTSVAGRRAERASPAAAELPIQFSVKGQATETTFDENRLAEGQAYREPAILKQVFINNLELQEQIAACQGIAE